jgi:hypothetical protein
MREYFRWENELGFNDRIDNEVIGSWLTERENLWESLEEESFEQLELNDIEHDPFDADPINQHLLDNDLVYSAGYVLRGKPHFFLADLIRVHEFDDYRIIVSGKEHARELSAPPALSQGKNIFIRAESLRRTVWEKVEESLWNREQTPLVRAISCYDFENNLEQSLQEMCDREIDTLVAHEIGEIQAGKVLGPAWQEMITEADHPLELMLRSVRDNLADCLSTLPDLHTNPDQARVHFFMANVSNMRKALFPSLRQAYDDWLLDKSMHHFSELAIKGRDHWLSVAEKLQESYSSKRKIDKDAFHIVLESSTL